MMESPLGETIFTGIGGFDLLMTYPPKIKPPKARIRENNRTALTLLLSIIKPPNILNQIKTTQEEDVVFSKTEEIER
jgi:hypothetical protein